MNHFNAPDAYDHDFSDETDPANLCKVCGKLLPWITIANDDERLCVYCAMEAVRNHRRKHGLPTEASSALPPPNNTGADSLNSVGAFTMVSVMWFTALAVLTLGWIFFHYLRELAL